MSTPTDNPSDSVENFYLICPNCLKQYTDEAVDFCPEDGSQLRKLRVDPEEDKLLGQLIDDRWKIETKLGQGGMGAVYLAQQVNMDRKVAIKVMRKGLDSGKEYIERFLREANVASKVTHPHMVSIFDFGQLEDGGLFIVMEYLEGYSLAEYIEHKRLTIDQTVDIATQMCAALAAAHSVGIIHRDLKPDNIFLIDMPGGDIFAKVLDFGIAKHLDAQKAVTQTGQVFGTPEYMSPEQCRGETGIDRRSDLYALGCILYELMCGRVPFRGNSLLKILFKHVSDPIPLLVPRHPDASLRELEKIALKLLEKTPELRYESALEVRDALEEARAFMKTRSALLPAWEIDESRRASRETINSGKHALRHSQQPTRPDREQPADDIPLAETLLPQEGDEELRKLLSGELEHSEAKAILDGGPRANAPDELAPEPVEAPFEEAFEEEGAQAKLVGVALLLLLLVIGGGVAAAAIAQVGPFASEPGGPSQSTPIAATDTTPAPTQDMGALASSELGGEADAGETDHATGGQNGGDDMAADMSSDFGGGADLGGEALAASHTTPKNTSGKKRGDEEKVGGKKKRNGKKKAPKLDTGDVRTRKYVAARVEVASKKARACVSVKYRRSPEHFSAYGEEPLKVAIKITLAPDGTVTKAAILNKHAIKVQSPQSLYRCIESGFKQVNFGKHLIFGTVESRKYTLTFPIVSGGAR